MDEGQVELEQPEGGDERPPEGLNIQAPPAPDGEEVVSRDSGDEQSDKREKGTSREKETSDERPPGDVEIQTPEAPAEEKIVEDVLPIDKTKRQAEAEKLTKRALIGLVVLAGVGGGYIILGPGFSRQYEEK